MEETRKTELRRIARLFRPYRVRLSAVLALILVSAGLGMVSPFLLRQVLDTAIPDKDMTLLTWLVLGMIGISIATGALGVAQTWISNVVGQRVMHDLRSAVYRHLQRLSLAFFTRTRTGEVQSRIANDIGGVQNVVTTTATSIVSNVTTVIARRCLPTRRVRKTKNGKRPSEKTARRQSSRNMAMMVAITVVRFETIEVAVDVTTVSTPPMSFAIRDWISPVRVRVKKARERRWRCR